MQTHHKKLNAPFDKPLEQKILPEISSILSYLSDVSLNQLIYATSTRCSLSEILILGNIVNGLINLGDY